MKTILLAVEGRSLDRKVLGYALNLCNPVRAGLDVLQIVRFGGRPKGFGGLRQRIAQAHAAFDKAMVAATYAEAGVPELSETVQREAMEKIRRLQPPEMDTAIDYHCIVTGENPDSVVMRYVEEHRNLVMAIYDTFRTKGKTAANSAATAAPIASGLLHGLSIPLVFVKDM